MRIIETAVTSAPVFEMHYMAEALIPFPLGLPGQRQQEPDHRIQMTEP